MDKKRPRVTAAILVEKDGKFLLAERNKENYNGYWVIPGGGVEFGEGLSDAAIREIKEETNLDVEIKRLICHKEIINVPGDYHSIIFFYLASQKSKNIQAKEDVSQAKFFSVEEIRQMKIAESVQMVLEELGLW